MQSLIDCHVKTNVDIALIAALGPCSRIHHPFMNIQKKTAGPSSKPREAPRVDVSSAGRLVPTATPLMHPGREADDRPAKTTPGSAGPALQSDGLIRDRFHLNPCCLNTSHLSTIYLFTFRVFCDGGVNHAGRQLAARSSEGGGVSLRDTSSLS